MQFDEDVYKLFATILSCSSIPEISYVKITGEIRNLNSEVHLLLTLGTDYELALDEIEVHSNGYKISIEQKIYDLIKDRTIKQKHIEGSIRIY